LHPHLHPHLPLRPHQRDRHSNAKQIWAAGSFHFTYIFFWTCGRRATTRQLKSAERKESTSTMTQSPNPLLVVPVPAWGGLPRKLLRSAIHFPGSPAGRRHLVQSAGTRSPRPTNGYDGGPSMSTCSPRTLSLHPHLHPHLPLRPHQRDRHSNAKQTCVRATQSRRPEAPFACTCGPAHAGPVPEQRDYGPSRLQPVRCAHLQRRRRGESSMWHRRKLHVAPASSPHSWGAVSAAGETGRIRQQWHASTNCRAPLDGPTHRLALVSGCRRYADGNPTQEIMQEPGTDVVIFSIDATTRDHLKIAFFFRESIGVAKARIG